MNKRVSKTAPGGPVRDDPVGAVTALFEETELAGFLPFPAPPASGAPGTAIACSAIGTTAGHALGGALLAGALAAEGIGLTPMPPPDGPAALLDSPGWQLCLVLSPWKRSVAAGLSQLAPSAARTGVVDTIVRAGTASIGFNTNTWAVRAALAHAGGPVEPRRLLILGSGASARSTALAVTRLWPDCSLLISARSADAASALARDFGALAVEAADVATAADADLVVNTTAWGETELSEQAEFPFAGQALFRPGGSFLDINNRISSLQREALHAGCRVMGGALMQRASHACRGRIARLLMTGGPA